MGGIQAFSIRTRPQDIGYPDSWVHGEIAVVGQIVNVGGSFKLNAELSGRAPLECSRCLKSFDQSVFFRFETEVEETDIRPQSDLVDISPFIREELIFQEPMKPLCSEECRGICSHCGAELNQMDCQCDRTVLDPRLAGLGRLLEP